MAKKNKQLHYFIEYNATYTNVIYMNRFEAEKKYGEEPAKNKQSDDYNIGTIYTYFQLIWQLPGASLLNNLLR